MKVTLWGTRGSLASSGPETKKYGGNTTCVEVRGNDDTLLVLDAGTGIRGLGLVIAKNIKRVNILLTHLHLDHIQGLGFFTPLFDSNMEVHIYGPARSEHHLHHLLTKYLSHPLFPVLLRDLPCQLHLHAVPKKEFSIGEFNILGQAVCHPGLTYGYRITSPAGSIAFIPDHEPALGVENFPSAPEWTSGYNLASNVDILLHDAQYTLEEYKQHIGYGHSAIQHAIAFAQLSKAKSLVFLHHAPSRTDKKLDAILEQAISTLNPELSIQGGCEGTVFTLPIQ